MSAQSTALRVAYLLALSSSWLACGSDDAQRPPSGHDAGPDTTAPKDAPADTAADIGLPGIETGPSLADVPVIETGVSSPDVPGAETGGGPDMQISEAKPSSIDVPNIDADLDAPVDLPPAASCKTGLSGTAPFGAQVSGSGTFPSALASSTAAAITSTITAYVYFPTGRVAGGQALLSMQSRVVQGLYFFGSPVTIASDLSATGLSVAGHDEIIKAELLPGSDGLRATVSANFSSPSTDVGDSRSASLTLCPSGDVPAPSLQVGTPVLSPLAPLSLTSSTPLATGALEGLRVTSPLGVVPIKLSTNSTAGSRYANGPNFFIAPTTAFPPGQPLTIDASQVHDVLGRPLAVTYSNTLVLTTTDGVADLSLDTAPPSGAVAGNACTSSAFPGLDASVPTGMSRCTGGIASTAGSVTFRKGGLTGVNVDGLVALPETKATKLRVRMSVGEPNTTGTSCLDGTRFASMVSGVMAVVGPSGEVSTPELLTCNGTYSDHVITLPSGSRLWLTVHIDGVLPVPFMSPAPTVPPVVIDTLELL